MERITPWLTEPSIEHIRRFLNNRPNSKILEFGCGSSTLWFDQNFDCELVSIEHDESWYNRTLNRISKAEKTTINLIERPYYHVVNNYDDNYFDIILIDGRDRVECFKHSESKLKIDGLMVLDNSERTKYAQILESYKEKETHIHNQPGPDRYGFTYPGWTTHIWVK